MLCGLEDFGGRAQEIEPSLRDLCLEYLKHVLNWEGEVTRTIAIEVVAAVAAPVISTVAIGPPCFGITDIEEQLAEIVDEVIADDEVAVAATVELDRRVKLIAGGLMELQGR